jgi:hypothetical protein
MKYEFKLNSQRGILQTNIDQNTVASPLCSQILDLIQTITSDTMKIMYLLIYRFILKLCTATVCYHDMQG